VFGPEGSFQPRPIFIGKGQEPTQVKHLSGAPLFVRLLASKSFIVQAPGVSLRLIYK